jgi:hypothetical protein
LRYGKSTNLITGDQLEKNKKISKERYGTEYFIQSKEIQDKVKNTCLSRYGVPFARQVKEFQEKGKITCLEKYGVDNIFKSSSFQDSNKIQNKQRFFNEVIKAFDCIPMFTLDEFVGVDQEYTWRCKICESIFSCNINNGIRPICPVCYPKSKSTPQQQIFEFLSSIIGTEQIIQNTRKIISPLELDFYIPNKCIAIEFNGNYWHSEIGANTPNTYHITKLLECEKKNIRLIQIFEDEWMFKQNIVKDRLKHILNKNNKKIYARECNIQYIASSIKNRFLNKYHIQGADKSSIVLGAFYRNRLVSIMTFGKKRIALGHSVNGDGFELMRFATIRGFSVVGIASKLLSRFDSDYNKPLIISYADRRWSIGSVYNKLGFVLDHISKPNYWYMKNYIKRYHRYNFAKYRLSGLLGDMYNPDVSEWDNMKNSGYDRIWDCGNYVFVKNATSTKYL